jgi:hypothetical protein
LPSEFADESASSSTLKMFLLAIALVGFAIGGIGIAVLLSIGEPDRPSKKPAPPPEPDHRSKEPDPFLGPGVISENPVVDPEGAWKVLTLVSLEYTLGDTTHPRDHSLAPYVPLLASLNPGVREVAALSATWELGVADLTRRAQGARARTEPRVPPELWAALDKAKRDGALASYEKADFWYDVKPVFNDSDVDWLTAVYQNFAKNKQLELVLAKMQAIMWHRAEALAKTMVKSKSDRESDVEVKGIFEFGERWGSVSVRNKSASDLEHITLSVTAVKEPPPPGNPGRDAVLGSGLSVAARGIDPARNAALGVNMAGAYANYRDASAMPMRRIVHVGKLAPGEECAVELFPYPLAFAETKSAGYSLWADGVTREGRLLPGYDAAKETLRLRQEEAKKPPDAQEKFSELARPRDGWLVLKIKQPLASGVSLWVEARRTTLGPGRNFGRAYWQPGRTEVRIFLPDGTYRVAVYRSSFGTDKETVYHNDALPVKAGTTKHIQVGP